MTPASLLADVRAVQDEARQLLAKLRRTGAPHEAVAEVTAILERAIEQEQELEEFT